jgi:putative transposase
MIRYIDEHKDRFRVEPICRALQGTAGGFMTSRGYRAAKARPASARALRDELLVKELVRVPAQGIW